MSDIDFGNAASSVAICTFWTDRKRLLTKIPKDSYSIIGNLYSSHGINFLLQTLLANTQIRTIALFGHCMTQSDEDLLNLWKNGVVQGKISGTKVAVLLSSDDVELVRKHVQLLDLRGKSLDELNAAVASLPAEPPYAEPRNVLFAEEARVETLPSPLSGHYLYEDSVFAAWIKILNYVMKFGERKMTEYSEEQKEYNNVMVTIGSSVDVVEMGFREFFSEAELHQYYEENILRGVTPESVGVSYTYGDRLFNLDGRNQVQYIIDKLGMHPYSRRAVAVLWQPEKDQEEEHGPCLNYLSCNIHDNAVYMTVLFRSNDIYNAWPKNVLSLMRLQQYIVAQINSRSHTSYVPGKFTITSVSAHVYQHNFREVLELIEQNINHLARFVVDPKGLFVVEVKEGLIQVEYRTNEGELIQTFSGKNGEELYKDIARDDIFSFFAHSAYLGYQIAKAEQSLKLGIPYVQDKSQNL
ncbi:MAG TPA: thymidylate synthase [Candidatus Nanoarchaeia archaeon]|nr:thymidylate synthase [Candidatus Nanoarchaeia archaeon]